MRYSVVNKQVLNCFVKFQILIKTEINMHFCMCWKFQNWFYFKNMLYVYDVARTLSNMICFKNPLLMVWNWQLVFHFYKVCIYKLKKNLQIEKFNYYFLILWKHYNFKAFHRYDTNYQILVNVTSSLIYFKPHVITQNVYVD